MANQIGLQNRQIRRTANSARPSQSLRAAQSRNFNTGNLSDTVGGVTAAIGGAVQLGNQFSDLASRGDSINTTAPMESFDNSGAPNYNIGQFAQEVYSIDPQGASGGDIASGALSGAATGASIGSVVPVIGTAVGAIGGALIGGLGSFFSGESGKSEMERKKRLAMANLRNAQRQYNSSTEYFNSQEAIKSQYNDMNNPYTRQNSLYSANNPYA